MAASAGFIAIQALLKEGKVQEASDLAAKLNAEAAAAEAAAAGKPVEPPPSRARSVILRDLLFAMAQAHGNPPGIEALLHEYEEADK